MQVTPTVTFNGQCEAAFRFYERCFDGKIVTMLTYGQSPMAGDVPEAWRDKIVHASLAIGDSSLLGADVVAEQYAAPAGMSVLLSVETPADAERVFQALAEQGSVTLPLQQTFWTLRYGMVTDRFGIPWEINCEQAPSAT